MTRLSEPLFLRYWLWSGPRIVAEPRRRGGIGHASTSLPSAVVPLIAAGSSDPVAEVSYGGKIGYEVSLRTRRHE